MRLALTATLLLALATPGIARAAAGYFTQLRPVGHSAIEGTTSVWLDATNWATASVAALRVESRSDLYSITSSEAVVTDVYTLNGPNPGSTVSVTLGMDVHYELFTDDFYSATINSVIWLPGGGFVSGLYTQENTSGRGYRVVGDPDVDLAHTLQVTVGQPFELSWGLKAITKIRCHIAAGNTATLDIQVPSGYTLTSQLGWNAVVPVEATTWSGIKRGPSGD